MPRCTCSTECTRGGSSAHALRGGFSAETTTLDNSFRGGQKKREEHSTSQALLGIC